MNERMSFSFEVPNLVANSHSSVRLEEELQGRLSHMGLVMEISILEARPYGDQRMAGMA